MNHNRIDCFDYLRCLGLCLVLLQHQLSVLDLKIYANFGPFNFGQSGVSIFLMISGALAMYGTRTPGDWLRARLVSIYPAFWIITIVGFIAAGLSGHKSFNAYQVASQLAGTGLFTHSSNLVNVATWYISLLLTLYICIFLAKLTKYRSLAIASLLSGSLILVVFNVNAVIFAHCSTFLIAALLFANGQVPSYRSLGLAISGLLLTSGFVCELGYPTIALFSLAATQQLGPVPKAMSLLSRYSYEFFLCHGLFLVGSQKLVGSLPVLSIPLGIISSLGAAVLLQHLTVRRKRPKIS